MLGAWLAVACAREPPPQSHASTEFPVRIELEPSATPAAFELVGTSSASACALGELEVAVRVEAEALRIRVVGFAARPRAADPLSPCQRHARAKVALDPAWLSERAQRVTIEVGSESRVHVLCTDGDRVRVGADGPELERTTGQLAAKRLGSCEAVGVAASATTSAAIVSILSEPPGAYLTLGEIEATTPYVATLRTQAEVMRMSLKLDGYETWVGALRKNESGHFAAEIRLRPLDQGSDESER